VTDEQPDIIGAVAGMDWETQIVPALTAPEATCDHTDCFNPGRHDYESVLLCDAHDRILNLQLRNDVLTERLDRMRVEVEALDHAWDCDSDKPRGAGMSCDCPIKDVLALIDGRTDDR
jgi:hypothetical protein